MGTRARGGITLYNVKNGKDAEYHRLRPQSEKAVVGGDNSLCITLSYIIEHVNGAQVTTEAGSAQGYHVTARMNNGVSIAMTNGAVNSGTYKLTDYSKEQNRPDYVIIELRDSADNVVDIRTAQIIMEASSYVDIVADLRTTVSQHGDSISTIKQTADSISLKVDGIKNGVKNLIKGGQLNRTISRAFAMVNDGELTVKLKPETDYTLTVNGRISSSAWDKRQMLRTYIFDKSWKGFMVDCDIQATYDTTNSVTFRIPKDKASVDNTYCFNCYSFPNQLPQGKNGEVTVNWAVVTEGTAPAAEWIPSADESSEERVKKVEAKLENGEFRVKSDKTVFVDNNGKETVLIEGGKLSAALIDAVKIVAAGLQAGNIDAKNATIKNLKVEGNSVFKGGLEGANGSFTSLDCLDDSKHKVGGITFGTMGNKGYMAFTGDFGMLGETTGDIRKRFHNFYATNLYCNSQFGHKSRVCAVIRDEEMFVYNDGHLDSIGIRIMLTFGLKEINGRKTNYYKIPMYSPGFGGESGEIMDIDNPKAQKGTQTYLDELPVGVPIDVVIFNCTRDSVYDFIGIGYGKQWTVINGNNNTSATICCHGGTFDVHGGYVLDCCYVNPAWLSPSSVDATSPGAGVMVGRELDMNW
nr:MAG TPA: hypothetical protein [Caudoviricetes sp.]